jgi:hypothetical protein
MIDKIYMIYVISEYRYWRSDSERIMYIHNHRSSFLSTILVIFSLTSFHIFSHSLILSSLLYASIFTNNINEMQKSCFPSLEFLFFFEGALHILYYFGVTTIINDWCRWLILINYQVALFNVWIQSQRRSLFSLQRKMSQRTSIRFTRTKF